MGYDNRCRPVKAGCWATARVLYLKNKPILTCLSFIEVYSNTPITEMPVCYDDGYFLP